MALTLGSVASCGGQSLERESRGAGSDQGAVGGTGNAAGTGGDGPLGGAGNAAGTGGTLGGMGNAAGTGGTGAISGNWVGVSPAAVCGASVIDNRIQPACGALTIEIEGGTRHLYFLFERSIAMGRTVPGSKSLGLWEAMSGALDEVFGWGDGRLRVGFGYFGRSGTDDDAADCSGAYRTPDVALGTLADAGPVIAQSMAAVEPAGRAPLGPAIDGALGYLMDTKQTLPGDVIELVVVAEGAPTQCEPGTVDEIAAIVRSAYETANIRTHVIGLSPDASLDPIAVAGGTAALVPVDGERFYSSFRAALAPIVWGCAYSLPSDLPEPPDAARFNLSFRSVDGSLESIPRVTSATGCLTSEYGGYYFDDPVNITGFSLCPCTCAGMGDGRVEAQLGCASLPPVN